VHRLIVTSGTYRQVSLTTSTGSAKIEGVKTLLGRHSLRRLSAEQLRDALLAVSGLLKTDHAGGPPIWPDLPADILQANPAFLDDNAEKTKGWYPSAKTNQNVRSVYLVQKRTVRVPFLETFDMPENSISCARRTESIVAPQALSLLNGSIAVEAARALAERVKSEAGDDPARQVEKVFAFALQRRPDSAETSQCLELLRSRSLAELCRAMLNVNEFVFVD
jgi:hypothetical protein